MSLHCLQVECAPKHSHVKVFPSTPRKRLATFGRVKEMMQLCQIQLFYILINQLAKNIKTKYIILQILEGTLLKIFNLKKSLVFSNEWNRCCVKSATSVSAFRLFCNCTQIQKSCVDYCCHLCFKMFDCSDVSDFLTWLNRSEVIDEW